MKMKVLLILIMICVAAEGVCRNGWIRFENSCYLFNINPLETWTAAMAYCKASQGHLVEINDITENEFIRNYLLKLQLGHDARFWIGGEDYEQEGYWVWASNGNKITQLFWAPGEPNTNGGPKDCINLISKSNYYWNDQKCDNPFSFICEKEDTQEVIG